MILKFVSLSVTFFFLFIDPTHLLASMTKIDLKIGESKTIPLSDEIVVSKKGVIDITDQGSSYLITGLKEGVVMISSSSDSTKKYFISVLKKTPRNNIKTDIIPTDSISSSSQEWIKLANICKKHPTLHCDKNSNLIYGNIATVNVWSQIKGICTRIGCLSNIKLDELQFQKIVKDLQNKIPTSFTVKNKEQNIFIETQCSKEESTSSKKIKEELKYLNYITNNLVDNLSIPLLCQTEQKQYFIKAYVIVLQDTVFEEYNLSFDKLIQENFNVFTQLINSNSIHKKAQVIAEPSLYLSPNNKTSVHSGGEFKYEYQGEDSKHESWKKTGIKMDFMITGVTKDSVNLSIDMELISEDSSSNDPGKLHSNSLTSKLNIPLQSVTLVGTLDVLLKSKNQSSSSFISKIPLLSSLISNRNESIMKNKLFLWVSIKEQDKDEEEIRIDVIN